MKYKVGICLLWYWVMVVVLLWVTWGMRLHGTAVLGLEADEGVHLVAAERVAAGDVLYRDLFENRTPGVEWLLAGVFRLTGSHFFVGRVLTVLTAMLTTAGLVAAGKAAFGRGAAAKKGWTAGLIAGLLFAFAPLTIFWSRYTMLEPWETAAAALSVASVLNALRTQKTGWWFAAGGLAGAAILSKQSGVVLLPLQAGLLGWLLLWRQISTRQLGAWLGGIGLVMGVFTAVLLLQGATGDFVHFLSGADRLAPLAGLPQKVQILGEWVLRQPALMLAIMGTVFVVWRLRLPTAFVLGWALVETVALLLPPQLDLGWGGFSHYVFPVVAAASLLAGVGLLVGWEIVGGSRTGRIVWGLMVLAALLPVVPAWGVDLDFTLRKVTNPQPDVVLEQQIGQALALVSQEDRPVLVFGNGGFYHWANRPPASKYFHLPGFLPGSALAEEAIGSWLAALSSPETGGLLISRMHLESRVPQPVREALWREWVPVRYFWYPYQHDMLLFVRRPQPSGGEPLAMFAGGVGLTAVHSQNLDDKTLLVQLEWLAAAPQETNYKVFVHLLRPDGTLAAQSDAEPMAGFAPMSNWEVNTAVPDMHWLELPEDISANSYSLFIGLYHAETGERLLLTSESNPVDGFVFPLE